MKKSYQILLTAGWQVDLSQDLKTGFIDYATTKNNWQIMFPELQETGASIDQWTDVDGLVVSGDVSKYPHICNVPHPLVVNHWIPDRPDIYQVALDPASAGIRAARHLINGGYRRLAALSCLQLNELNERAEAFYDESVRNDCTCDKFILPGVPQQQAIERVIAWLVAGNFPAAVFCTEDFTGAALIRALTEAGLYVPEDVAVLGCEDSRTRCEGVRPSLSSVHPPYRKAGFEAARMLDALLSGKKPETRQVYLPTVNISERMSTAIFSTRDPQLRRAIEFIRRHACEGITVEEAARHAGLCLRTLQYRFKEEVGHSAKEEISRVRMDKVQLLLRDTDLPLDDIAEATGYQSGFYLSRLFKNKKGLTTRQYRNRHRR